MLFAILGKRCFSWPPLFSPFPEISKRVSSGDMDKKGVEVVQGSCYGHHGNLQPRGPFFNDQECLLKSLQSCPLVCLSVFLFAPFGAFFLEAFHWPLDHMISSRPLIGPPSLIPGPTPLFFSEAFLPPVWDSFFFPDH